VNRLLPKIGLSNFCTSLAYIILVDVVLLFVDKICQSTKVPKDELIPYTKRSYIHAH